MAICSRASTQTHARALFLGGELRKTWSETQPDSEPDRDRPEPIVSDGAEFVSD